MRPLLLRFAFVLFSYLMISVTILIYHLSLDDMLLYNAVCFLDREIYSS